MISTINAYKQLFNSMILNNFGMADRRSEGGDSFNMDISEKINRSDNISEYLNSKNLDSIIKLLRSVDWWNKLSTFFDWNNENNILTSEDLEWSIEKDKEAVLKLLRALNIEEGYLEKGWFEISYIIKKLREEVKKNEKETWEKLKKHGEVVDTTSESEKKIEKEVGLDLKEEWTKIEEKRTKEKVGRGTNSFLWLDFLSPDSEVNTYLKYPWIKELLRNNDINSLDAKIKRLNRKLSESWFDFEEESFKDYFITDNYSKAFKEVLWDTYKADWWYLDSQEAYSLYFSIKNYLETQKKVPSLSVEERMKLMFDFDKNGKLQVPVNANVWEAQAYTLTFESINSREADALIQNLWFWNIEDLTEKMQSNLFATRERFQNALLSSIEWWFNPSQLVIPWKMEKITNKLVENREGLRSITDNIVDRWRTDFFWVVNTKRRKDWQKEITTQEQDTFTQRLKNALLQSAIWISHLDNKTAWWINISFSDLTPEASKKVEKFFWDFLDVISPDVSIWWWLGWIWASLNMWLFEEFTKKYGVNVTAWLYNFVNPFLSTAYTHQRDIWKMESMFQETIDTKIQPTIYLWVAPWYSAAWVAFSEVNQNTSAWIEKMSIEMLKYLKKVWKDILAWKENISSWKDQDKKAYIEMKKMFDIRTEKMKLEKRQIYMDIFMEWFARNYRNYLYKNADKYETISVWLWVLMSSWFLPLPYLTLWAEIKNQEFRKVNNAKTDREVEETTFRQLELENVWAKIEKEDGKQFLSIPKSSINIISDSTWKLQVKVDWENILVWWVSIESLKFVEHISYDKKIVTLVSWEWKVGKNWEYVNSWYIEWEDWLIIKEVEKLWNDFDALRKRLENVKEGFNYKTRYNAKKALLNPQAPLEERWDALIKLAELGDRKRKVNYWENGLWIGNLWKTDLLKIVNKVNVEGNDKKKEYVLSRVLAFMSKAKDFDWKSPSEMVEKEKVSRRTGVFDDIWEKELKLLNFSGERNSYYELLKWLKKPYVLKTITDKPVTNPSNKYETPKAIVNWFAFDATSTIYDSKWSSHKWINFLKWDLDIIADKNGDPIKLKIEDSEKINKLKELAREKGMKDTDNLVFYFYKDPYWFDDRILISRVWEEIKTVWVSSSSDSFSQENTVATAWLLFWGDRKEDDTPEDTPEDSPEDTPEDSPEDTPEDSPEDTPEDSPEDTPEDSPEDTPEDTPDTFPENTQEDTPEDTPEDSPEDTPDTFPENTQEDTPENTPEDSPEDTPDTFPENTQEDTPENTPEDSIEDTPDTFPENTQEDTKNPVNNTEE